MRRTPLRTRPSHSAKARATDLHAKIVRHRGACERCGSRWALACAHIIRRTYSATRTDETNGWCLCPGCHQTVDTNQYEFHRLVALTIGAHKYERLMRKARAGVGSKVDWEAEVVRLTAIWKALNS